MLSSVVHRLVFFVRREAQATEDWKEQPNCRIRCESPTICIFALVARFGNHELRGRWGSLFHISSRGMQLGSRESKGDGANVAQPFASFRIVIYYFIFFHTHSIFRIFLGIFDKKKK